MGYRRPKAAAYEAMKWREFNAVQRDPFAEAGLPGTLTDRQRFLYFLEHGYVDDGSAFTVDGLDGEQRKALLQLVRLYMAQFEPEADPDSYLSALGLR